MKARTDYPKTEMYTELQWAKKGCVISPAEKKHGQKLWTNHFCSLAAIYYMPAQVKTAETEAEKQQIADLLEPRKQWARLSRMRRKEHRKQQELKEQERQRQEQAHRQELEALCGKLEQGRSLCRFVCPEVLEQPVSTIVLDTETTGLNVSGSGLQDEILQIALIDMQGHTLFNSYIKPYAHQSWPEAESVNHISPAMVQNAPYLHEVAAKLKGYLNAAELLIGYNSIGFDVPMLEQALGPFSDSKKQFDAMLEFAPIYGEWSDKYNDYKFKSLSVCAEHFGVQFDPHDALEDSRATLACYQAICRYHRQQIEKLRRPKHTPDKDQSR